MTGIGQSDLLTTPMHLCLIASAIANGGTMMEPRLIAQVTASDGTVRRRFESRIERQIYTDHNVADTLKEYMYDTVNAEGGTGRAAALNGWRICGKDGIIEADGQERADALFIGFIDDASAPYAIAIVLEDTGSGSDYAAPVAHDIFEYLTEHLQNTD